MRKIAFVTVTIAAAAAFFTSRPECHRENLAETAAAVAWFRYAAAFLFLGDRRGSNRS
jgi:hypothetical protein